MGWDEAEGRGKGGGAGVAIAPPAQNLRRGYNYSTRFSERSGGSHEAEGRGKGGSAGGAVAPPAQPVAGRSEAGWPEAGQD